MPLTLYVTTSSTTTQLNDGAPFRLESAEGLSGSDVIRYEQGGPFQNGVTDLGFHLNPRTITLSMLFYASTAALLDTYRAALMAAFKPLDSTSITLSVSRDDSEIRTLACFAMSELAISLVPEEYPGHLHRATVQLRAASPLWQANSATIGTASVGPWYLAGGAIAAANVKMNKTFPGQNEAQSWVGPITGDWSVAIVTAKDTTHPGTVTIAWADGQTLGAGSVSFRKTVLNTYTIHDTGVGSAWPGTTDYNYHVVESRSGTQYWRYWTAGSITQYATYAIDATLADQFTWRGDRASAGNEWTPEVRKGAILGTVTINQLQALGPYIMGTVPATMSIVNDGDVYAYPVITLVGDMTDPIIVNTTTASTIDLTGITLAAADVMTIDLRDGNKTIYARGTANFLGSATTFPVALASFALAPAPIAAGGTNTISLSTSAIGSASYISVQFINQYMSF